MKILLVTEEKNAGDPLEPSLAAILESSPITCNNVASAERLLSSDEPFDLLIVDFRHPDISSLESVERLNKLRENCATVILVDAPAQEFVRRALRIGITATLPLNFSSVDLACALRMIERDYSLFVLPGSELGPIRLKDHTLSRRELQILEQLCEGHQNKEIAHAFGIQEVTVKMHMRAIIRKLGARNRTHAAMIARDQGLI